MNTREEDDVNTTGVAITWYGHGTWQHRDPSGAVIIVDPWLGGPTVPDALKSPAQVDAILVTHGHFDHIADVESLAKAHGCPVIAKVELAGLFASRGLETIGFNTGGTAEHAGVRFTMTQAHHSSSVDGPDGTTLYVGEPAGFVITFSNGYRVYQSGDTAVFGDMALIGAIYHPDLAILSIGDFYTMGPLEAAHAVRLLGVKDVIGGHWGTFPPLTGRPAALADEIRTLGLDGVTVHPLQPGDTLQR
jgi:L-ascorbate metabolism protein UlaG (beta-lactamase superfamily)